jgi:OTU domain-containing protein 7
MFGIHDRNLQLRRCLVANREQCPVHSSTVFLRSRSALKKAMSGALEPKFRRRWQVAMKLTEEAPSKWSSRWDDLQRQTSLTPTLQKSGATKFEFLEQMHVFALAHILRRPILVYADGCIRKDG